MFDVATTQIIRYITSNRKFTARRLWLTKLWTFPMPPGKPTFFLTTAAATSIREIMTQQKKSAPNGRDDAQCDEA